MSIKQPIEIIWIFYTTLYRKGGTNFERAAMTLEAEKKASHPEIPIRREAIESKKDFFRSLSEIQQQGNRIRELHFIGHSGMYGPMFGTTSWPEQFSPYEWRTMEISFAVEAQAWFHACRSARWFAPFFARTFNIPVHGNHWYTSFSRRPEKFRVPWPPHNHNKPLYVIGCPGKKSHGLAGSFLKYFGLARAEKIKLFEPQDPEGDTTYNSVAELYTEVFSDITIRHDEWRWLDARIPKEPKVRVLDIGCGNGALLYQLADRISRGAGVDRSDRMLQIAADRCTQFPHLSFSQVADPFLPFPDRSFDIVISLLSFRYLDWDPIMNEIRRILTPEGKLLVIDMVTVPVQIKEYVMLLIHKARNFIQLRKNPRYRKALNHMVRTPDWQTMLKHNPIRAEHEYKWYLESRFPGRKVELLNLGWSSRVLAFESGPMQSAVIKPLTYP